MVLAPFQPIVPAVPKPLRSTTTFYSPWVYAPNGVTSTLNFVQGIGEGTRKYLAGKLGLRKQGMRPLRQKLRKETLQTMQAVLLAQQKSA